MENRIINIAVVATNLNQRHLESNDIKEEYLGRFLEICSMYIGKLDDFRKMINKHISTAKIEEQAKKTKSNDFIDLGLKEFYTLFETTF